MRQIFISCLIVLAASANAAASERYPSGKNYVNQNGQVLAIGQASHVSEIAVSAVEITRALPRAQLGVLAPTPLRANPDTRLIAARLQSNASVTPHQRLSTNISQRQSERACCQPGQPYFNEFPDS